VLILNQIMLTVPMILIERQHNKELVLCVRVVRKKGKFYFLVIFLLLEAYVYIQVLFVDVTRTFNSVPLQDLIPLSRFHF